MAFSSLSQRRSFKRASQESRRQDLVDAALKLIGEGGPQAATVRAIADEAGVTAGLIRHYFNTKEELVRAAYQDLMIELNAKSMKDVTAEITDPKLRLRRYVLASITPPNLDPDSVGKWAGFLHLVRNDLELREIHRTSYLNEREVLQKLIAEAQPNLANEDLNRCATACLAVIDGLWLEGSLISDSFAPNEIAVAGLSAVGAILGIDLIAA